MPLGQTWERNTGLSCPVSDSHVSNEEDDFHHQKRMNVKFPPEIFKFLLTHIKVYLVLILLFFLLFIYLFIYLFYCILGFGVHVQNMQDSCIGTHMAVCFASFLPFTHIWPFSPGYPSPSPPPIGPPLFSQQTQCLVFPSLCPCVLIFHHPPMSKNMRCFIFCSCVSLLRMMFSRFIHVPTNNTNSSFLIAA